MGSGCVAQLVEQSLPIPEVRGSNPVIGKIYLYIEHLFTVNCVLKRRKIKKKRPGMAHFFKKKKKNIKFILSYRVPDKRLKIGTF